MNIVIVFNEYDYNGQARIPTDEGISSHSVNAPLLNNGQVPNSDCVWSAQSDLQSQAL